MSGEGSPSTVAPGGTTTFSSLDVTFAIATSLVVAGIGAGVLDFVLDSATFGTVDPNTGGDGVNNGDEHHDGAVHGVERHRCRRHRNNR